MEQSFPSHSAEQEHAELERVLAALARTPRLVKILRYIAEKHFQNRAHEINEYNLATEVLGRSKSSFDASRDAIARVEAFRLRKRLKEYYSTEGKDHDIQISLPSGNYVPAFIRLDAMPQRSSAAPPLPEEEEIDILAETLGDEEEETLDLPKTSAAKSSFAGLSVLHKQPWLYGVAGIAALLTVSFGIFWSIVHSKSSHWPGVATSLPLNASPTSPQNAAQVPLRLLAGYNGAPKIDSASAYWQADRYYRGGGAFRRPGDTVERTSDPMLFESWRTGDFSYDIPLAPGSYELHLYFVASPADDFKKSSFNVNVNNQPLLKSFNIRSDALGANIADERIFKDISPDKDGLLHLAFFMERSAPTLNALEILPSQPHQQLPIRMVMQPSAVTDHNGTPWHPDNYFQNGAQSDPPRQVSGTPDPNIYAQERYGHFDYAIPVDTHGRYTLVLHFAELYWGPQTTDFHGIGDRVFRVYCNGSTLLDNLDIYHEAGSLHALTKTFSHLRPSSEGKLDITFDPINNYATVSAIEVIDESE